AGSYSTEAPVGASLLATAVAKQPAIDHQALLLTIVADRTGYPTDMLGLDADLEADLGIDSIKRVEIVGALRKAVPETIATAIQQNMERYTKARTLSAILAELATLKPAEPAATPPASCLLPHSSGEAAALPRYVIKSRPAPLATQTVALSGLAVLL